MELLNQLTQNLGISPDQAKGGAGLIFKLAQEKLKEGDFQQVQNAVPGMGEILSAAPSGSGLGKAVGGIASSLLGGGGAAGGLAGLAEGFTKLGLNPGMVGKFVPIILAFVQDKGGEKIKSLLEGVIK